MSSPGYIPGPLVIPATVQVRFHWFLPNSRVATNVMHAIVPDGFVPDTIACNTIMAAVGGWTDIDTYFDFLAPTTSLLRVDIRDIRERDQAIFEGDGAAIPGTGIANALPEEVALVVTLRTGLAGPAHRGRVYLCGYDSSALDADGHAVPGLTAAAKALVEQISTGMSDAGMSLGVGHRGHAEYINAKGATVLEELPGTDLVTQIRVRDNVFDSQRRRK
jgi:hypothetical protein